MTVKWNQALFPYFILPFLVLEDLGQFSFFRAALCDNTKCIPFFKAMFLTRFFVFVVVVLLSFLLLLFYLYLFIFIFYGKEHTIIFFLKSKRKRYMLEITMVLLLNLNCLSPKVLSKVD